MTDNIEIQILVKIKKAKRGSLFFIEDFLRFGNSKAISKALERLVEKGEISRVARGIYTRMEKDLILGPVKPGTEAITLSTRMDSNNHAASTYHQKIRFNAE